MSFVHTRRTLLRQSLETCYFFLPLFTLLVLFVFAIVLHFFSIRLGAELIKVECDCKVATSLEQEEYFEF